ncbi:uncharacterized protein [Palaemon carinicauda]|uniref:uncharacterized protein n=1 Tax=Palaemon carinicauda TaxID=392227 RepID=UPI0035B6A6F4
MTMSPLFYHPKVMEKQRSLKFLNIFMIVLLVAILGVSFFFAFYKRGWTTSPEPKLVLNEALSQVCSESQARLRYEGVHSFFQHLEQTQSLCPTIGGLGEMTDPDHNDGKKETSVRYIVESDVGNWPHFCLSSRDSSQEPCRALYFTSSGQNEEVPVYVESLGCLHYVFSNKVPSIGGSSNVRKTSILEEDAAYPYEATGHPRDLRTSGIKRVGDFVEGNWLNQQIEDIATSTGEAVSKVHFISIDAKGQEWPILTQLVASHDQIDIRQVSARIHLPDDIRTMSEVEMHLHFSELHQILEGLNCLGYKLIFSQPLVTEIMEIGGQRYPMAYQVSWLKEKSIA